MVEPSQSARDAAADLMQSMPLGGLVGSVEVREGGNDSHRFVQAFAQAEQRGHAQGAAEVAELVAEVGRLDAAWAEHVRLTEWCNANIPDHFSGKSTRAEVALYDERYQAKEEATREFHRVCVQFVMARAVEKDRERMAIEAKYKSWLTQGGEAKIAEAMARAKTTSDEFARSTRVRHETLYEPCAALSPPRVREADEQQTDVPYRTPDPGK